MNKETKLWYPVFSSGTIKKTAVGTAPILFISKSFVLSISNKLGWIENIRTFWSNVLNMPAFVSLAVSMVPIKAAAIIWSDLAYAHSLFLWYGTDSKTLRNSMILPICTYVESSPCSWQYLNSNKAKPKKNEPALLSQNGSRTDFSVWIRFSAMSLTNSYALSISPWE